MLTEAQLVLRPPSGRSVIEFLLLPRSVTMAKAQKVRNLAIGRSGGTEPAASIPLWELEIVQGRGGGEVAERSPARKAHGRPADPHVDHKRLAATGYRTFLFTQANCSQFVNVSDWIST